ncbi:MAG: trypsin-like peptidase domain-containing protein [Chloroflexota bacterium]
MSLILVSVIVTSGCGTVRQAVAPKQPTEIPYTPVPTGPKPTSTPSIVDLLPTPTQRAIPTEGPLADPEKVARATATAVRGAARGVPAPPVVAAAPPRAGGTGVSSVSETALQRALEASVLILVPIGEDDGQAGSGTVVSQAGHILTNFHVVSDKKSRQILNGGKVIVAVPQVPGAPAKPKYRASVVDSDPNLDLALLKIEAMADGAPMPANLGLTPLPVGNSDAVRIGDTFTILGYPGTGGVAVTVTRGIHSGFQNFVDAGMFIKTDTEISPGNSGGTAINAAGELVGVPTAGIVSLSGLGKIGLLRPINLAAPMLQKNRAGR